MGARTPLPARVGLWSMRAISRACLSLSASLHRGDSAAELIREITAVPPMALPASSTRSLLSMSASSASRMVASRPMVWKSLKEARFAGWTLSRSMPARRIAHSIRSLDRPVAYCRSRSSAACLWGVGSGRSMEVFLSRCGYRVRRRPALSERPVCRCAGRDEPLRAGRASHRDATAPLG